MSAAQGSIGCLLLSGLVYWCRPRKKKRRKKDYVPKIKKKKKHNIATTETDDDSDDDYDEYEVVQSRGWCSRYFCCWCDALYDCLLATCKCLCILLVMFICLMVCFVLLHKLGFTVDYVLARNSGTCPSDDPRYVFANLVKAHK